MTSYRIGWDVARGRVSILFNRDTRALTLIADSTDFARAARQNGFNGTHVREAEARGRAEGEVSLPSHLSVVGNYHSLGYPERPAIEPSGGFSTFRLAVPHQGRAIDESMPAVLEDTGGNHFLLPMKRLFDVLNRPLVEQDILTQTIQYFGDEQSPAETARRTIRFSGDVRIELVQQMLFRLLAAEAEYAPLRRLRDEPYGQDHGFWAALNLRRIGSKVVRLFHGVCVFREDRQAMSAEVLKRIAPDDVSVIGPDLIITGRTGSFRAHLLTADGRYRTALVEDAEAFGAVDGRASPVYAAFDRPVCVG